MHKSIKAQNLFLLVASYFFYGLWDYRFLSLIILSSFTDYTIGFYIKKSNSSTIRKLFLLASLSINLGFLFVFKYYNFFIESFVDLTSLMGLQTNINSLNVILPVGISFYTFQTLSYTIDIYKNKLKPTKNILNFFTYVSFFPQLVAGPIERASQLLPQIENKRSFRYIKAKDGMRQILWGLFKKVVVADNCAAFVDPIFNNYTEFGGLVLIIGAVLFAFQIYCDFSGYSDIAIGTAKLLGFNLMQNFAMPYFSRDIAEFWRRWHISLSTWFRDYVYIPLGGSRVSKLLQLRNIFAIFLISGFWHGANWTFIFWGLIHALCYIPQTFLKTNRKYVNVVAKNKLFPSLSDLFRINKTFIIVTFAWIFFRSPTIYDSFLYIQKTVCFNSMSLVKSIEYLNLQLVNLVLVFFFISIALIFEWINRDNFHGLQNLSKSVYIRLLTYVVLSLLILEYFYGEQSFIYFQF